MYAMTLDDNHKVTMLVMIIEKRQNDFVYRVFFARSSKRKTYHQGADDSKCLYSKVWRLAPRGDSVRQQDPQDARIGQTIRFMYDDEFYTALVIGRKARTIITQLECGQHRGDQREFEYPEMLVCSEIFGSSIVQNLFMGLDTVPWVEADKSKSETRVPHRPKLHREFMCPETETNKRIWHVGKILEKGQDLLCKSTNARAKRCLSRSSSNSYTKRWRDLQPGPRFWLFLGVKLGVSILAIGSRHLMRISPSWISQLGKGKLFEKLPTDIYRLWSSNFVAHTHRETTLFKRSIREQRSRFYGNRELNKIVYGNSRRARDPPGRISGDETIKRLYTRKASDIRMRTSKKNESGTLNQNLCGSNEGYDT